MNSTPIVGADGTLYLAAAGGGGGTSYPDFAGRLATSDANGNGKLEQGELPSGPIKSFIGQFDRDKNGALDQQEYESIRKILAMSRDVVMAIRPGGTGDITESHVRWTVTSGVPRSPTPVYYDGHLYLVKDGGILTTVNCESGEIVRQGRLAGTGKYFSSPIIAGGKLYVLDDRGKLSVASATPEWERLGSTEFPEDCYASPAVAGGRLYVRTVSHLYCLK